MEQARLKYRIVGGIVLVALAAILVPLLNDVRQPLPQGPQAIDIPNEPTDGVAQHIPADGAQLDGQVPEPDAMPEPVPPPLTEDDGPAESPSVTQPEAAPPAPGAAPPAVRPAPASPPRPPSTTSARPEPVKPAPKPVAPAVVAKPSPATLPPAVAKPAPPVAKAVPVKPTPVTPAPAVTAAPPPASAKPPSAPAVQQAWVVQLGVFGNVKTAIDLRESLRKAGHSAFTEEVATPHGKALRVRVGPELERATAQALRDRLARETGHDGIVMAYP